MSQTTKVKQKIALLSFCLSCAVSFVATGVVIGLFFPKEEEQDGQLVSAPLVVKPNLLDFQEVGEGEHEGVVHLVNRSNRRIALIFAKSSCFCSVLELPGNLIAPGKTMTVKCTLSTIGRSSGSVGGVTLVSPMMKQPRQCMLLSNSRR